MKLYSEILNNTLYSLGKFLKTVYEPIIKIYVLLWVKQWSSQVMIVYMPSQLSVVLTCDLAGVS